MTPSPPGPGLAWVDAFADGPFRGNPAAVCLLDAPAPAPAMQALAAELGLSETAFVWPESDRHALRWFTPAAEVDLCGHATVAAAAVLARRHRRSPAEWEFATRSGAVRAVVSGRLEAPTVVVHLPIARPSALEVPPVLADRWPVVAGAAGGADLIVEVPGEADVLAIEPFGAIATLPWRGVIVTAATAGGATVAPGADYVLRFFAPAVGVPEDPVTGSAQCALGPYWAARLGRDELQAAQLSARGGRLDVRVAADHVEVGGAAQVVWEGALTGPAARLVAGRTR